MIYICYYSNMSEGPDKRNDVHSNEFDFKSLSHGISFFKYERSHLKLLGIFPKGIKVTERSYSRRRPRFSWW